jgi:hypothetical protein
LAPMLFGAGFYVSLLSCLVLSLHSTCIMIITSMHSL